MCENDASFIGLFDRRRENLDGIDAGLRIARQFEIGRHRLGARVAQVHRVDRADMVDAQTANDGLDVDFLGGGALQGDARSGVFLLPGHGGRAIVENTDDHIRVVVDEVEQ